MKICTYVICMTLNDYPLYGVSTGIRERKDEEKCLCEKFVALANFM